jgi:hypothetical protein
VKPAPTAEDAVTFAEHLSALIRVRRKEVARLAQQYGDAEHELLELERELREVKRS